MRQPLTDREQLLSKIDRRDKIGRAFGLVILSLLVLLNVFAVFQISNRARTASSQLHAVSNANKARLDINLCIVSVPPQTRTPDYVRHCYDTVDKLDNVKVTRYGYGL